MPAAVTLTIEKPVHGALGLGRLPDGRVVLAAGALPGETVLADITREQRGLALAEAREILRPSPDRVAPPCPHYADCGGCDLQHASHPAQLRMKTAIARECLTRAGVLPPEDTEDPTPTIPSPEPFGYRLRLRLHVDADGRPGFHARRSHRVVPARRCLLAAEGVNAALEKIAAHAPLRGFLAERVRELTIARCPETGRVALILHGGKSLAALNLKERGRAAALLAEAGPADWTLTDRGLVLQRRAADPPLLRQRFTRAGRDYTLAWPAGSFFQAHARLNEELVDRVVAAARRDAPDRALDLFCGAGNFSIPLALAGTAVLGVEIDRAAALQARRNAARNGLNEERARFLAADVAAELARRRGQGERRACVLLDPPRQGLGRAAAPLADMAPERVVSVSCDPATHARDLRLLQDRGYRLVRFTVADMFPQTHHIEAVAEMRRQA